MFLGLCVPPPPLQRLPKAEGSGRDAVGPPRVDPSVLLAAGLPTASAVACQGSINFLLEESVRTPEWICFSQRQLSAQASALGGCRGAGGTHWASGGLQSVGQRERTDERGHITGG